MGMKEDSIELMGSALDKMLLIMEETGSTGILIQDAMGKWSLTGVRPSVGTGKYIEVMPGGEVREYSNSSENETSYQRIKHLRFKKRR